MAGSFPRHRPGAGAPAGGLFRRRRSPLGSADAEEIAQTVGRQAAQGLQAGRNGELLSPRLVREMARTGVRIAAPGISAGTIRQAAARFARSAAQRCMCAGRSFAAGRRSACSRSWARGGPRRRRPERAAQGVRRGDLAAAGVTAWSAAWRAEAIGRRGAHGGRAGGLAAAAIARARLRARMLSIRRAYSEELAARALDAGGSDRSSANTRREPRAAQGLVSRRATALHRRACAAARSMAEGSGYLRDAAGDRQLRRWSTGREVFAVPGSICSPLSAAHQPPDAHRAGQTRRWRPGTSSSAIAGLSRVRRKRARPGPLLFRTG